VREYKSQGGAESLENLLPTLHRLQQYRLVRQIRHNDRLKKAFAEVCIPLLLQTRELVGTASRSSNPVTCSEKLLDEVRGDEAL